MKRALAGMLIFLCAGILLTANQATAQSTGIVSGRITDDSTGEPLPSASVSIAGTRIGAVSRLDGYYRVTGVPIGNQTIEVSYIGYEKAELSVKVGADAVATLNVSMEPTVIEAGTVVVKGMRQGEVRALARQKNADNIKNIVSSENIGRFPDPNAAEAVQRMPGISIQRDQGEGRYVLIRGMAARLNSMTLNGERLPSPEGDVRSVALDVIPTDVIGSIEVNKALTPDMDADAIGGSVNIVTKTARDYTGQVVRGTLAGGYNDIVEDDNYQGALTYARTFGPEDKLGFLFSGSYYKTDRGSQNTEFAYDTAEFGDDDEVWVLDEYEMRDYRVTRTRMGLNSTVDYKFDDNNRIFFTGVFNKFDDDEIRRRVRYKSKGDYFTDQFTSEEGSFSRDFKDRFESQEIMSFILGGEHLLPTFRQLNIDYQLSYSYAQEEEPDRVDAAFEYDDDVALKWDLDDPDFPKYTILQGADIEDYSAYELDELVLEDNLTTEHDFIGGVNGELPININDMPGSLKFGGKIRAKKKDRENDARIYSWDGDDDYTLDQVLGSYTNSDFLDGKTESLGKNPDPDKIWSHFVANKDQYEYEADDSRVDTDPANYEATELITAAYGQGKLNMGKFMVLAGVRLENTSLDYTGNIVEVNEDGDYVRTREVSKTGGYLNAFPMVHVKYSLNEDTNIRAAVTTAIARPDYYSLVPYDLINREDEEIERGNPDLDPTKAVGLDLMAEHYFRPLGIVSGGIFYKNLQDFIYEQYTEINGGKYDSYLLTMPVNGDDATLWGLEMNWMYQLAFLPGALNGLGIYANYTYTDSEVSLPIDVGEKRDATLPGQAENIANFALSYEKYGFNGRLSLNYHGKYIDEVGEVAAEDVFYDNHTQLDLSLSQQVYPGVRLFAEFINLTDEPLRYYVGTDSRPKQQEYYSFWTYFGVKFSL